MARAANGSGKVRVSAAVTGTLGSLLVALVVVAGVLTHPRPAAACTVIARPLAEYSEEVDVAFFGRVIERRGLEKDGDLTYIEEVTFEVYRVYKGEVGPHIRFVWTRPRFSLQRLQAGKDQCASQAG